MRGGGRPRSAPEPTAFAPDLQRLLGLLEDLHTFLGAVWKGHEPTAEAVAKGTASAVSVNVRRLTAVAAKVGDLPTGVKAVVAQVARLSGQLQPAELET